MTTTARLGARASAVDSRSVAAKTLAGMVTTTSRREHGLVVLSAADDVDAMAAEILSLPPCVPRPNPHARSAGYYNELLVVTPLQATALLNACHLVGLIDVNKSSLIFQVRNTIFRVGMVTATSTEVAPKLAQYMPVETVAFYLPEEGSDERYYTLNIADLVKRAVVTKKRKRTDDDSTAAQIMMPFNMIDVVTGDETTTLTALVAQLNANLETYFRVLVLEHKSFFACYVLFKYINVTSRLHGRQNRVASESKESVLSRSDYQRIFAGYIVKNMFDQCQGTDFTDTIFNVNISHVIITLIRNISGRSDRLTPLECRVLRQMQEEVAANPNDVDRDVDMQLLMDLVSTRAVRDQIRADAQLNIAAPI